MSEMKIDTNILNIPNKRDNFGLNFSLNKIQTKD